MAACITPEVHCAVLLEPFSSSRNRIGVSLRALNHLVPAYVGH